MNRKMRMIGKRTGRLLVVMTGCLFFLYIGACGLPVSIQLHCLMLPYSMQREDAEKGIYQGITGCMPLYAYAKEQVEVDGQDLATTYILLEGRDESHEVLQAERNSEETIDENRSESNSDGQMDHENDQLVSNDGDTEKAQGIQVGKNDNTNVEEVVESMENTQSEQDESSDIEEDRENADIDAMASENQKAVMDQLMAAHVGKQPPDLTPYQDFDTLLQTFYVLDSTTYIDNTELNIDKLLNQDLTIAKGSEKPQILIYHTHAQEGYADSVEGDLSTTVVGAGDQLASLLEERGFCVLHDRGIYDTDRDYAYSVAAPALQQILTEHPSIEVIIDLHRDGVGEDTHLVTEYQGQKTAQFMFFNGLSRTRKAGEIPYLVNENRDANLAFSFQMQLKCQQYYPGLARRIYLKGYRYNMQYRARSLLVELGAQTNTLEEVHNAVPLLADVIASVLEGEK
ncbi:stage II sporulation protein P [Kineothrix sp. MSJ-39]|uniref:stage II sporulation protein P n=1 Tax=Kineothrix sp. MSJ-39 TaxID=2841533 RepID=UPI001C100859|nr:stage II sporulation protein P [Kineothrix sp. MSJ-39]MBU5430193.1 stage II sporulation protein P [Kineothrix sp. MSJ-39]